MRLYNYLCLVKICNHENIAMHAYLLQKGYMPDRVW